MVGLGEFALILVLALILIGPDKLPEVARTLGKLYAEYKHAMRRLELEILYGVEPPSDDLLEKIYEKKINLNKSVEEKLFK